VQKQKGLRSKLQDSGPNRKGFPMVEGPGCKFEEARGFLCKSAQLRRGGANLIRWIEIRQLGFTAGAGVAVDRY
jgi:hypothetical protein